MKKRNKRKPDRPRVIGSAVSIIFPLICAPYNYYTAKSEGRENAAGAYATMGIISGGIQLISWLAYKKTQAITT